MKGRGGEENVKLSPSFTTISTIAIQAGQSQLVVSVLRSGSLVHLQLVQVHPGLCEIGWNQEENQKLIQEQQQLIHKLQKHESEALSSVKRREEEETELKEAMGASLSEGWSLLLHLLHRRQEVLMMASDFYHRALEFDVSINKLENLQMRPDEVQLRFDSMRKDVLLKSLQVLNSSNVLLDKLQQLQSTEALQRRGAVLQDQQGAGGCEEMSSQSSQEVALRLEELVEMLQDRRRRADQAVRLQLQQAETSVVVRKKESGSEDWTLILDQNLESESTPAEGTHLQTHSRTEESRDRQTGSRSGPKPESSTVQKPRVKLVVRSGSRSDIQSGSRSEETRKLESGSRSELTSRSRLERNKDLQSESSSEDNVEPHLGSDLKPGSRSDKTGNLQQQETKTNSGRVDRYSGEDHTHQVLPTSQQQELLSSCERLVDKVWSWVQQSSNVLSHSSEAGRNLTEAEDALNTHMQLHTQAESACQDAENLKQILDQVRAPHTGPRAGPGQLSPLRALTEQLKRGRQTRTDAAAPLSPELAARADVVLTELQSVNRTIESNLQLLHTYVLFLGAAQQLEEEIEEVREVYRRRGEEEEGEDEEERGAADSSRSPPQKKKRVDARWEETLQRLHAAQEVGNSFVQIVTMASGSGLDLHSVASVVQRTIKQLIRTKQEVNELRSHHQVQIRQQEVTSHRKYRERLLKALQDLRSVSELLDSCTNVDLGSDLQTSTLTERFSQATPLFTQLDAEVEQVMRSWKRLRGDQEVEEEEEDNMSELLRLQKKVKEQLEQSEWILDLSSSFHLRAQQLEALLLSDSDGSHEKQELIQSLFTTAAALKTNICTAAAQCDWAGFKLQQLELRLLSLDSLCVSWLNEAARRGEELRRERVTRQINDDIAQLRDSLKELKKRFNNLKFNFLKRNDRTRNMKAVRNQLQQVELYEDKLQSQLRKRLQGLRAQLGLEGVAREVEDTVNELQRQMGELEQSVSEHRKTLDMTCRLQRAMEEYQSWCEEASATITRVQKFSSDCRSTEAVTVLYRQFEKFVWPTVPQQEERISQIGDLAVRLHGVEEGRRYIERTVSKHSEMVASIRELSDGLMELEAKLKLKPEKQQQNDGEKEIKEEDEERTRQNEMREEETEKKLRENRKMKTTEQCELKETGHTPELTGKDDWKEVPVKKQNAANRKPPLQKSHNQEADQQEVTTEIRYTDHRHESNSSSYCSTHTFSLSCSPVEASRRVSATLSPLQPNSTEAQTTPPYPVTGPSLCDVQRECQRKEDASDLSEVELHQQEVLTEDSLSNDEYECASPDDISLPPLAETPESGLVQSDFEEGFCFSSRSAHVNQHSHQAQSGQSGTGAVQQQRGSSQTEGYAPPPTNHNNPRFRSESSSFVQSPLTVPAPGLLSILRTEEASVDFFLSSTEAHFTSRSNQVHKSKTTDKFTDVPERRSPSETEPLLNDLNSQFNQPQCTGSQSNSNRNVTSKSETLPQTDPIPHPADQSPTLQSNYCPQPLNGPDTDIHKDKTPLQDTGFLKCGFDQDTNFSQTRKETSVVSKPDSPTNTSSVTQQNVFIQSSHSDTLPQERNSHSSPHKSSLSQNKTKNYLIPHARGFAQSPNLTDSVVHNDRTLPPDIRTCLQTNTSLLQHNNLPQSFPDSSLDQSELSTQPSKETSSVKTVYCQSSSSDSPCNVPQAGITLRAKQDDLPDVHVPNNTELESNRFSNKQSHITVYSVHESLTQCVHDPGMSPSSTAKPTAPPLPQTQAHPHPPHLLTSDQDPDICQPMAIREEIRLTPQIHGPPLPAPPLPQAQAESLPRGKASKPGPPCFTRARSRATVKEGSPVTLEVEVTGHPEPTLTWPPHAVTEAVCCLTSCHRGRSRSKDGDTSPGPSPVCDGGKHFLFIPEALDSDGGLHDVVKHQWLVAEVFDLFSVDWQTWFGTLCVLLWLLYLILL
ncbi:coiled-coil domain-containing protein 141 isoform X3 [Paralichthys olivaceus]|uniref:coiled-coil domain-containing protein 141 isoform X3 n=1 Tax=Paralichthys olivaceus TaxID=8255 RepID=UPI003751D880